MSIGYFSKLDDVLRRVGGYPVLAWVSQASAYCTDANDTLFAYTGVSEDKVETIHWLDLVAPAYRSEAELAWTASAASRKLHNAQVRLVGDQEYMPLWDLLGIPEEHPELGTVWLFVAAPIQAYPEEIEAEHRQQLAEFRETMDDVNLLGFYYSAFGSVRYLNKRLAAVFAIGEDDPLRFGIGGIGDGCATQLRFVPPADRSDSIATWIYSMKTGTAHEVEYRLMNEDGTAKWFQIRVEAVMDRSGERILCWGGYCIETDRKHRAAESLAEARKALADATHVASLAEMAGAIAHEVNQPLGAITANAHAALRWLQQEPARKDRALSAIDRIIRDSVAAGTIVKRLADPLQMEGIEV